MSVSSEITRIQNEVSEQTELISQIQTTLSSKSSSSNITVDSTLTMEGQAADAKVTGDKLNNLNENKANVVDGAVVSSGSDYAVCFEWHDGNPDKEERTNRFVQLADGGNKIAFATFDADICGVTTDTAAFVENYDIESEYTSLVGILGVVTVIDNGACTVGETCMSDDNGYAVPSTNDMGYRVMERLDENKIRIAVKPNDDMVQRIKLDMDNKINSPATATVGQTIKVKAVDENGKPTEWETCDFPEQVQANWNQNDSTASDYIKNRPFYEGDRVETELFDVCALVDAAGASWTQSDEGYLCVGLINSDTLVIDTPPEIGDKCTIKYNGSSYECTAEDGTNYGENGLIVLGDINYAITGNMTYGVIMTLAPYTVIDSSDTSGRYIIYYIMDFNGAAPTELKVSGFALEIIKIDSKFINFSDFPAETDPTVPDWAKQETKPTYTAEEVGAMSETDPVGTGSFSMGRKNGTSIGEYSHAEGYDTTASGKYSHAEGYGTTASGSSSHAEGYSTTASDEESHAEGYKTTASGMYSHAEGCSTKASNSGSHAEGYGTTASGSSSHAEGRDTNALGSQSHAEGYGTTALGKYSHAEGYGTTARRKSQNVYGEYNVLDTSGSSYDVRGQYVHIVGNGISDSARSNAHTLDWDGNAWYAGTIEGTALILNSSTEGSTKRFKITVDDSGTLTATEVT